MATPLPPPSARAAAWVPLILAAGLGSLPNPLLQRLIEKGRHPAIHWGNFADVQRDARTLYQGNGWAPLWLSAGRVTASAHALLDALATAGDRGLDPEDYDAAQLAALAATIDRGGADAEQAIRFDAALTIGALRFVQALGQGRIAPREANVGFSTPLPPFDPVAPVEALRHTDHPEPILQGLEPTWWSYWVLERALGHYRQIARDPAMLRLPRPRPSGVHRGEEYSGAAALGRLLAALGDLPSLGPEPDSGGGVFTAELEDGLLRFQTRLSLRTSGVLDEPTWIQLTQRWGTLTRRMELALERWRWIPRELGEDPVLVSAPALRLHYPDRENDPSLVRMSVRIGNGPCRETPVLGGVLTMLVFRPAERGAGGSGRRGSSIAVKFPLQGDFYLDGGSLEESAEPEAGCVWVADAELLAELLLRGRPEWTPERIGEVIAGKRQVYVRLPRPVPVLLVYGTAVAGNNGQVFFSSDLYGQDRRLDQLLRRGYPYPR